VQELKDWESFYVIVGSSGAALTGLQFVVIALTVDVRRRSSTKEIDAFATPTIVHFCVALVVAAILSAPWATIRGPQVLRGLMGWLGVAYAVTVGVRAQRTHYRPVLEDWIFHVALPFAAYIAIAIAALVLGEYATSGLFSIAAATLLLLLVGIHNAWDTVTFIAFTDPESPVSANAEPRPAKDSKSRAG
jgi:hypothetical protein